MQNVKLAFVAAAVALLALPLAASAHDVLNGPNGGQVVDDAGHHVEFVAKGGDIVLYLSDDADKPLSSAKATGRVVIQEGSSVFTVELASAEPNMLGSKLAAPLAAGSKLAVTITLGDGHAVKARFVMR
jgi:hypothetical protein